MDKTSTKASKTQVNESTTPAALNLSRRETRTNWTDGRASTSEQANLLDAMQQTPQAQRHARTAEQINNSPRQLRQRNKLKNIGNVPMQMQGLEEEPVQGKFADVQRQQLEDEELLQGKFDPLQRQSLEEDEPLQGRFVSNEIPLQRQAVKGECENRTGMPNQLKAGLEQLSGMDLSAVRVHHNSPKPAQLNALAYAQGRDIHLGSGQEKHLPHEAWHTVQQMQGRVKPTTQAKGVAINDELGLEHEADVMGAKALQMRQSDKTTESVSDDLLQRQKLQAVQAAESMPLTPLAGRQNQGSAAIQRVKKEVIVTGVSHLVKLEHGNLYGDDNEVREIIHGQTLVIDTDAKKRSRRGPNQEEFSAVDESGPQHYVWFKVISIDGKKAPSKFYVREDVFVPVKKPKSGPDTLDKIHDTVAAITDVPATLIGNEGVTGVADALNDKTVFTNTSVQNTASASDKTHAANMGITGDSITGVIGLLSLAKGFKDLGDPEAKAADLIETALSIEQGGMKTGEAVSKLVHTASGSSNATTASKFGSTFEGFGGAFGALKEGFNGIRKIVTAINEHQDNSTEDKLKATGEITLHLLETAKGIVLSVKAFIELVTGAASGGLMASVPGLDIAVSAGKLIMDGYYLALSNNNRKVMNERRKLIVAAKGGEDLDASAKFYQSKDAEIANKKEVIKNDEKRLNNSKTSSKDKRRLKKRIVRLKHEIKQIEVTEATDHSAEDVAEYTMATELRDANRKRVIRQGIHIATEMTKIAGSIATLTGVGGLGGAITKGAAASVDLALPAVRLAKQAGRDRAARKIAKGKMNKSKFNITKSSAAKADFRLKQVKYLIKMIIDVSYKDPETDAADFKNVLKYLNATGVNTKKLFKKGDDPQKQISMLLDSLQEREFI